MSGIAKTPVLTEEGGNNQCKKRCSSASEQCTKRVKSEEMSANEKKSNFSLVAPNSNGTIKMNSSSMNKPGATTKKLVIKNFKSVFMLSFESS